MEFLSSRCRIFWLGAKGKKRSHQRVQSLRSTNRNSQYYVAWPIMKEFGYPFTLFIYTQWVNTGGKAISWAQLEEMRDAGVDIEAHTVSHHDLRHAPRGFPVVRSAKAEEAR